MLRAALTELELDEELDKEVVTARRRFRRLRTGVFGREAEVSEEELDDEEEGVLVFDFAFGMVEQN